MRILFILFLLMLQLPLSSKKNQKEWVGTASFYSNKFNGRKTANGEIFSNKAMTAANNFLPLGTKVLVTNIKNGKSVVVKINDRLHARNKRLIDLTYAAAAQLGFVKQGTCKVHMVIWSKKKDGFDIPKEKVEEEELKN